MGNGKVPNWLRMVDIAFGLVAIALGIAAIVFPGVAVLTLVLLLFVALLVLGTGGIIRGALAKFLPKGLRVVSAVTGVIAIIFAVVAMVYPNVAVATLVLLLAFGLTLYGFGRIMFGAIAEFYPKWLRALFIVGGAFTIILSFIVLVIPAIGLLTLVAMLAVALLWNGMDAIAIGVTGTP